MTNEERTSKVWYCPTCKEEIGKVIYGQLYMEGSMIVNTDGPNLVVKCPHCGARKVWFARDRMSEVISEFAKAVAREMQTR